MDGTLYPYDSPDKKYKNSTKQRIIHQNKIKIIKKYQKNVTDIEIQEILLKAKNSNLDTSVFLSKYFLVDIEAIYKEKMDIEPYFINYDEKLVIFLKNLKERNIKLFIVTGSPKIWSDNCLEKLKIKNFFTEILNNNFYQEKKEKAYSYILEKYQLEPKNVLVVGDNYKNDILPAENLGISAVHIDLAESELIKILQKKNA